MSPRPSSTGLWIGSYGDSASAVNAASGTDAEQAELSRWIASIEDTEAAYLRPANDRLRAAAEALEERNRTLGALIRRKESLVERLQRVTAEADAERTAIDIDAEVKRLLPSEPSVAVGA